MIQINNKENCCGCSACANACVKNCIVMKADEEGFIYPIVDRKQCIECGVCELACPMQNVLKQKKDNKTYVAYAKKEEIRMSSSSGGIFSLIAEWVLEKNGIVFGAAFDSNFEVYHIEINNKIDLLKLRGSKYVQSNIGRTYVQTRQYLLTGKFVLYSGTACQIAGLKKYLNRDYNNLITIDILCHGTPSPKVWDRYLKEMQKKYNGLIKNIFFRKKIPGWKKYSISIKFNNGQNYRCVHNCDNFIKLFLSNICLRPSCYNCKFKDINRPSDITLGDCWGIEYYMPEMDDDRGTSVIITHSDRGENVLNNIRNKLLIKEAELDKALPPSADSRKSVVKHPRRNEFFNKLNKGRSIADLVKLLNPKFSQKVKYKIKNMYINIK